MANAKGTMFAGNKEYAAVSGFDGTYSLRIFGIYSDIANVIDCIHGNKKIAFRSPTRNAAITRVNTFMFDI